MRCPFHQYPPKLNAFITVGVLELTTDLCLLDETLEDLGAPREVAMEHLERDVASQIRVATLEHDAHAATRDLAEQLVVATALGYGSRLVRRGVDQG